MVDILAMNPLHLFLYIVIFTIIITFIAIVVSYLKTLKQKRKDNEKIKLIVSYMKDGFRNGYSAEDLVSYLMLNGWSLCDCNRALKVLKKKPL